MTPARATPVVTLSATARGWFVHDPTVRREGFGPLTKEEAVAVQHTKNQTLAHGSHDPTACPPTTQQTCRHAELTTTALKKVPELSRVLDT